MVWNKPSENRDMVCLRPKSGVTGNIRLWLYYSVKIKSYFIRIYNIVINWFSLSLIQTLIVSSKTPWKSILSKMCHFGTFLGCGVIIFSLTFSLNEEWAEYLQAKLVFQFIVWLSFFCKILWQNLKQRQLLPENNVCKSDDFMENEWFYTYSFKVDAFIATKKTENGTCLKTVYL